MKYRALPIHVLSVGHAVHAEHMVLRNWSRRPVHFTNLVVLIRHPLHGPILFDTGYSEKFFKETSQFPFSIYSKLVPAFLPEETKIETQLKNLGLEPADIKYVILSHFHSDHIGALHLFKNARYICFRSAFEKVKEMRGFWAMMHGFIPTLLPFDFVEKAILINSPIGNTPHPDFSPFDHVIDYFGDASIFLVPLDGHERGQMGIIVNDEKRGLTFFCADACWLRESYQNCQMPSNITRIFIDHWKQYGANITKLNEIYRSEKKIQIVPSHCEKTFLEFYAGDQGL